MGKLQHGFRGGDVGSAARCGAKFSPPRPTHPPARSRTEAVPPPQPPPPFHSPSCALVVAPLCFRLRFRRYRARTSDRSPRRSPFGHEADPHEVITHGIRRRLGSRHHISSQTAARLPRESIRAHPPAQVKRASSTVEAEGHQGGTTLTTRSEP